MATAASLSFSVKNTGVSTVVPDDDIARLMYYLNCITKGVGLDILQDDLIDYQRYHSLSPTRIAGVLKMAAELSPDELMGKLIFLDDEHDFIPKNKSNTFLSISAACNLFSISSSMVIAGRVQDVSEVMLFTSRWLEQNYTKPIERIARTILGTKHCSHCEGNGGICTCTSCPRAPESKCQPFFNALLDAFIAPSAPARSPSPAPKALSLPAGAHSANCDGCSWATFTGSRYKCTVCDDYDLCEPCYKRGVHDKWHPFMEIKSQGAKPNYLPSRASTAPRQPSVPPKKANPPAPPPYTPSYNLSTGMSRDGTDNSSHKSSSPFFYTSMSIGELRSFLRDRGVSSGGIFDKENLCKQVWETHCESMSIAEVNKFLMDNKISTADCRSITSRRQKAKDAFRPPSRPAQPPASTNTSQIRFKRDDNIVLKGLARADMNGKHGTVLSVDHAAGRVQVRVPDMDKSFKVKFENLDLQEEDEELE